MSPQTLYPAPTTVTQNDHNEVHSSFGNDQKSSSQSRVWVPLLLVPLVLASIAIVISKSNSTPSQHSPAIGKPAPQIDLVRLSNEPTLQMVQSVEPGKVTLLHCWGTWCGPCRMEYPHISEMSRELSADSRFVFRSVSCESGPAETFQGLLMKTQEYFQSLGVIDEVFADHNGTTRRSLVERMEQNSFSYPTSVLIDGQGNIAGVWVGYTSGSVSEMRSQATTLMASCGR